MGWYPARDKNNKVPPENMTFPQVPRNTSVLEYRGKRAHQSMRGTKQKPLPAVGTPGGCARRPKTMYRILSENAMVLGWHNGKRIRKDAKAK